MKRKAYFSAGLLLAAALALPGCGNSQSTGQSEAAAGDTSQSMQQMTLAEARGKMSAYAIVAKRSGNPALQTRMADLQTQFKAHLQTAQQLILQRGMADAAKKPQFNDQYDDNLRQIKHIVAQGKALEMKALTGG